MKGHRLILNLAVAALVLAAPAGAGPESLASLFDRLKQADAGEARRIEAEIRLEWARSGSPVLDLLLQRGIEALEAGDSTTAAAHFTAILDEDPGFVEARAERAMAYQAAGETGPALGDMAAALAADPQRFDVLAALGGILEETGDKAGALAALRAAAAIHPHLEAVNEAIARLEAALQGREI